MRLGIYARAGKRILMRECNRCSPRTNCESRLADGRRPTDDALSVTIALSGTALEYLNCRIKGKNVETLLLQDWVTIDGNIGVASVTQGADAWLDIADHEDLIFYLDVKQLTNAPLMNYETAPVREDRSFLPVITPFTLATGVRADPALFAYALTPPARHVRWRVTSTNTSLSWNVTFRVWLAGYSLG